MIGGGAHPTLPDTSGVSDPRRRIFVPRLISDQKSDLLIDIIVRSIACIIIHRHGLSPPFQRLSG